MPAGFDPSSPTYVLFLKHVLLDVLVVLLC